MLRSDFVVCVSVVGGSVVFDLVEVIVEDLGCLFV